MTNIHHFRYKREKKAGLPGLCIGGQQKSATVVVVVWKKKEKSFHFSLTLEIFLTLSTANVDKNQSFFLCRFWWKVLTHEYFTMEERWMRKMNGMGNKKKSIRAHTKLFFSNGFDLLRALWRCVCDNEWHTNKFLFRFSSVLRSLLHGIYWVLFFFLFRQTSVSHCFGVFLITS